MKFTYALTGWEGSASDAQIWGSAVATDLIIPPGTYLLADAGFLSCQELLVPYCGVRYHLAEWGWASLRYFSLLYTTFSEFYITRPANKEEVFNLCHAQARNVIERIFGVLKHRFWILLLGQGYSLKVQAQLPAALAAIHNFILHHDPNEGTIPGKTHAEHFNYASHAGDIAVRDYRNENVTSAEEDEVATNRRNTIAQQMWDSYQQVLLERAGDDEITDEFMEVDGYEDISDAD